MCESKKLDFFYVTVAAFAPRYPNCSGARTLMRLPMIGKLALQSIKEAPVYCLLSADFGSEPATNLTGRRSSSFWPQQYPTHSMSSTNDFTIPLLTAPKQCCFFLFYFHIPHGQDLEACAEPPLVKKSPHFRQRRRLQYVDDTWNESKKGSADHASFT